MSEQYLDSGALQGLNQLLGTTGGANRVYVDQLLQVAVDTQKVIRRGRTLAASEGLYSGNLGNVHAGAGTLTVAVDPYAVAAIASKGAGWPDPVPDYLDVWLLRVQAIATAAASTTSAVLSVQYPVKKLGIFTLSSVMGQPVFSSVQATLGEVTINGQVWLRPLGDGKLETYPVMRVPRGATIQWQSVATLAVSHYATFVLGLFPAGLGQDAIGAG